MSSGAPRSGTRGAVDSTTAFGQVLGVRAASVLIGLIGLLGVGAAGCRGGACVSLCDKRAKELSCRHPEACKASCEKLHTAPSCGAELKAFEACFLKEPLPRWECDDNGQPALKDGVCPAERRACVACLQAHPPAPAAP